MSQVTANDRKDVEHPGKRASTVEKDRFVRHLRWLPNAITLSRAMLACVAFTYILHHDWVISFWFLTAALATDFLDGLAAKKLNAITKFGEEFDGLTDSFVVIVGMVGLSATSHLSWLLTAIVLLAGAVIGDGFFAKQAQKKWRKPAGVICLFLAWIGIMWFYAYLAFGWSWWYVPLTIIILVICGLLKRHRIRAWLRS